MDQDMDQHTDQENELKNKKMKKIMLIILIILISYFIILPIIFSVVIFGSCSGKSEFCGLELFVLFPHLFIVFDFHDNISLSTAAVVLISLFSFTFTFIIKHLLGRYKKFDMGYSMAIIIALILSVIFTITINNASYKHKPNDWQGWALEAISSGDPKLCIKKVDPSYQENCLNEAALTTGNLIFCKKLSDKSVKTLFLNEKRCTMNVKIVENLSRKLCSGNYDRICVTNQLEIKCDTLDNFYSCPSISSFNEIINELASEFLDTSWCNFYAGVQDEDKYINECLASVSYNQAVVNLDTSWCEKINHKDDEYNLSTIRNCRNQVFEGLAKTNMDTSWCEKIVAADTNEWSEKQKSELIYDCRDKVFLKKAINTLDTSWCDKITGESYLVGDCYHNVNSQ